MTAANREDILWDLQWNRTILDALASTFMKAIPIFQREPALEFDWFGYLPSQNDHIEPLFQPAAVVLHNLVCQSAVVKCQDDVYRHPAMVRFPAHFTMGAEGTGLLPANVLPFSYVSQRYSETVKIHLRELGVFDMTFQDFIDGLLTMKNLHDQSAEWLEKVCMLLCFHGTMGNPAAGVKWTLVDFRIRSLRLVRLSDGTWTNCENSNTLFFNPDNTHAPPGLGISIVDLPPGSASQRQLLERMGVRPVTTVYIMEKMLSLTTSSRSRPTVQEVLEQALWLFDHRLEVPAPQPGSITLVSDYSVASSSNTLYFDSIPAVHGAIKLKDVLLTPAKFLHPEIAHPKRFHDDGVSEEPSTLSAGIIRQSSMLPNFLPDAAMTPKQRLALWHEWLQNVLCVSAVPRVIDGRPTREFVDFVNRTRLKKPAQLLHALRQFWPDIMRTQLTQQAQIATFCKWLSSVEMRCHNGIVAPMGSTFLPNAFVHLGQADPDMPVLPISDPDAGWMFLKDFGVSIEPDAKFYLKRLVALSSSPDVSFQMVRQIYKQLEARFREIPQEIRCALGSDLAQNHYAEVAYFSEAFRTQPLFFIEGRWCNRSAVVWDGPSICTIKKRMRMEYAPLEDLFQVHLGLSDADPTIVADELELFARSHRAEHIKPADLDSLFQILAYASSTVALIKNGTCKDWTPSVQNVMFLPVRLAGSPETISLKRPAGTWFLPDPSGHLEDLFSSRLDFIAFHRPQLALLVPLLQHLNFESKRINHAATEMIMVDGVPFADARLEVKRNMSETHFYRSRLLCFQRCVPASKPWTFSH